MARNRIADAPSVALAVILPDLGETFEHPVEVGWKVHPFPPEFWRRASVQALNPHLAYYGPLPQSRTFIRQIVGDYPSPAYVYVIQAFDGDVLYVGKTICPESRLTTHRKTKEWWPTDGALTLLGIEAENAKEAHAVSLYLESLAIHDCGPKFNIAGVRR